MLKRRGADAGIRDLHPHAFRHTWAHAFRAAGGNEGDLMLLGGWRSRAMLDRYGKAAAADRAADAYHRLSLAIASDLGAARRKHGARRRFRRIGATVPRRIRWYRCATPGSRGRHALGRRYSPGEPGFRVLVFYAGRCSGRPRSGSGGRWAPARTRARSPAEGSGSGRPRRGGRPDGSSGRAAGRRLRRTTGLLVWRQERKGGCGGRDRWRRAGLVAAGFAV
jgi:hypothetical protein